MTGGLSTDEAVRSLLLLMPRLVGRAKRLPMPAQLRELDLAPRHLSLLAHLQYDGQLSVGELAARLDVAPTTVSLMVTELSNHGILVRREDDHDRRRRIVAITPSMEGPIAEWLSGNSRAWLTALEALNDTQRDIVVRTLQAYESALNVELDSQPAEGR